jgi:RNA polymerase sigma-70 factor, ECF subfamily
MSVHGLSPAGLPLSLLEGEGAESDRAADPSRRSKATAKRLRGVVDRHYDFLWRTLHFLGVPSASVEDAVQRVLCVVARRLDDIAPEAEMSFLFATAARVASETRRAARRHPCVPCDVDALVAAAPSPEQLVQELQAQEVLRQVLDAMPFELRVVFVMFEIEELTLAQVASIVGIPVGTVSSRLRRARLHFRRIVRKLQARASVRGGP